MILKEHFKKSNTLINAYSMYLKLLTYISPKVAIKTVYRISMGKRLDLNNPKTLNEKLMWCELNCYYENDLVKQCIDKYEVRNYIKSKGLEYILNEIYGVWDHVNEIDWNSLPDKFILKCNHASGYNIICKDKNKFDIEEAKAKLNKWMKVNDFGRNAAELIYIGIKPKIICEHLIETEDGDSPKDYKIFCSYGEPKFMFVASERQGDHAKFDFYDMNWDWIPVKNGHPNAGNIISKPKHFNEMCYVARELAYKFPIVRVDFYDEEDKLIFGEITFLHFGGRTPFDPDIYDRFFGDMMPIKKLL